MNPQMDILYVSDTGHILTVFTRAGRPQQPEKVPDAFVGAGLHVRGLDVPPNAAPFTDYNNQDFIIPAGHVLFSSTDQTPSVLAAPRGSYIDANQKLHPLAQTGVTPTFLSPTLTITLTSAPAGALNYLVLIAQQSQGTPAMPLTGSITGTTALVTIPSLPAGSYYALVFVATYSAKVLNI
jgi:hypothetical protein